MILKETIKSAGTLFVTLTYLWFPAFASFFRCLFSLSALMTVGLQADICTHRLDVWRDPGWKCRKRNLAQIVPNHLILYFITQLKDRRSAANCPGPREAGLDMCEQECTRQSMLPVGIDLRRIWAVNWKLPTKTWLDLFRSDTFCWGVLSVCNTWCTSWYWGTVAGFPVTPDHHS